MTAYQHIVILITVAGIEEARKIAGMLVSERLAACCNIVPGVSSIFRWAGKTEEDGEILLVVKTRAGLFPGIVNLVKKHHSYEVPEIIALPVVDGNADYLVWIDKETEMTRQIKIKMGDIELEAWLNETDTANKVWAGLPITAMINLWGEEIYFPTPIENGLENAEEVVNSGDIAYWPTGKAMCLFFGKTPASRGEEIRPISPVNVIGKITGDTELLKEARQGDRITIEKKEPAS